MMARFLIVAILWFSIAATLSFCAATETINTLYEHQTGGNDK